MIKTMLTTKMLVLLAQELYEVRKDNRSEGSEYFKAMMNMIQEDERYNVDFQMILSMTEGLGNK